MICDLPLIEYSWKSYSVDECIDECYRLMKTGYACAAFEYNLDNSTCRFIENNFQTNNTKYYSPYWDHYMLTNTKRKLIKLILDIRNIMLYSKL